MSKKSNTKEFIEKAKKIHGDKYDYFLVDYVTVKQKVKIICPVHGEFEQIPNNHLNGLGCKKCSGNIELTNEEFIEKAKKIHGDKYDYSDSTYVKSYLKIVIKCKKHGIYNQTPNDHLSGKGCMTCRNENTGDISRNSTEDVIKKSKEIHGDKYDYSKVNYKNNSTKIIIVCPIHGEFLQTSKDHILGKQGCPVCKESKGEKEIAKLLTEMNLEFEREKRFKDCRNKRPLPFDFYIPSINTVIEFQGKQHYHSVEYFGGVKELEYRQNNDKIKSDYCISKNIKLITIKYDESVLAKLNEIGVA